MEMEDELVLKSLKESIKAKERFFIKKNIVRLRDSAEVIAEAFKAGGLMVVGNGGSAADAQHIAAEFVNRFEIERPPLPAIALTTDTSVITSIGNDYGVDTIFSKQVKAIGREGDVLLAISTSGTSPNVVQAVGEAKKLGIKTIALVGRGGGDMAEKADLVLNVEANSTPRIQEVHITACHILCELVDYMLFQKVSK
jgi:D-sedoheptulose 7-phosphate isomerase